MFQCIFFIWCFAPIENNGSIFFYNRIIRPRFLEHESFINSAFTRATDSGKQILVSKRRSTVKQQSLGLKSSRPLLFLFLIKKKLTKKTDTQLFGQSRCASYLRSHAETAFCVPYLSTSGCVSTRSYSVKTEQV